MINIYELEFKLKTPISFKKYKVQEENSIYFGFVHVVFTYSNMIVTLTNKWGKVVTTYSAGLFVAPRGKGVSFRKNSATAKQLGILIGKKAFNTNYFFLGFSYKGRYNNFILKGLEEGIKSQGIYLLREDDNFKFTHARNGCKKRKARRI